jgi:hypothetical protein
MHEWTDGIFGTSREQLDQAALETAAAAASAASTNETTSPAP